MLVYLNGEILPLEAARVSPLDRGFLFGDGVYEGLRSVAWAGGRGRRMVALSRHVSRMRGGLSGAGIAFEPESLVEPSHRLLEAAGLADAFVYWQVTRGEPGPGDAVRTRLPPAGMRPTAFAYCAPQPALDSFVSPTARSAVTVEDRRWTRGHLKSISLMGNVLSSMEAQGAGADEAILVRGGLVAEGVATNVIIAERGGGLVTPSLESVSILAGVTRAVLLGEAPGIVERGVSLGELKRAAEIMLVGTTTMVQSVTMLDGEAVGGGVPGPAAEMLLKTLVRAIKSGRDEAPA